MTTHTLKIIHDTNAENPWTAWDSEPPLYTEGGRGYGSNSYRFSQEDPIQAILEQITDSRLIRHSKAIIEAFGREWHDTFEEAKERYGYTRLEYLTERMREIPTNIENIAKLCDIFKIPYHQWASIGYSQGDYLDCIIVLTDEYIQSIDTKPKHYQEIMVSSAKLWDAYAWGDVYGFQLIEHAPLYNEDSELSEKTEDTILDSCYGFYGDEGLDDIKSHLPLEHQHLHAEAIQNITY